ncbi:MAG: hypothetical protein IT317_22365 [Anaerolineales bacterium]|nr:hypothetical protein [Anaerolineales bacterium]
MAIYEGPGATKRSVRNIERSIGLIPGAAAVRVTAEQMRSGGLAEFDVVVFPGGSASAQAKALDRRGRDEVQKYVAGGGGYLGVCAGAYLACAGFDWGLQLVNARTLSDRWQRGEGAVEIALTDEGRQMFGPCRRALAVHYENGPVFGPLDRDDLPAYRVLATYATEVAENNTPAGIMVGAPALAESSYGEGRVIISSPHPEASPGLESIVPLALVRLAAKEASERNGSPAKER